MDHGGDRHVRSGAESLQERHVAVAARRTKRQVLDANVHIRQGGSA